MITPVSVPADDPIGRGDAMRQLREAIASADAGRPTAVLVTGVGGIGKSTLLDAMAGQVEGAVVRVEGDAEESLIDFALFDQLVRRAGIDRETVAGASTEPAECGARLLEWMGEASATSTLAILVDDAHLADGFSLRALSFAVRRLRAERVLVALAVGAADADTGRPALPSGLTRLAQVTGGTVVLEGLDVDAVSRLVTEAFGRQVPRRAVQRLHAHTAGHPLYTRLLLEQVEFADLVAGERLPAPASFRAFVLGQLARCAPAGREVAASLAVLDGPASVDELTHIVGVRDVGPAVDELVGAGLLRTGRAPSGRTPGAGRSVEFAHELIKASVYDDLPTDRRVELHASAARLGHGDRLSHLVAASTGTDDTLAEMLAGAAADEIRSGHHRIGAYRFLDAADLTADVGRREAWTIAGADELLVVGESVDHLEARLLASADTSARNAVLGRLAMSRSEWEDARRWLERAWKQLTPDADDAVVAMVADQLALVAMSTLAPDELLRWGRAAVDAGGAIVPATLICHAIALTTGPRDALTQMNALVEGAAAAVIRADAQLGRGIAALWSGELDLAARDLGDVVHSDGDGLFSQTLTATSYLADLALRRGQTTESIDQATRAVALADDAGVTWMSPLPRSIAAFGLARAGRLAEAREHVDLTDELAELSRHAPAKLWAIHARLRVAEAERRHDEVVECFGLLVAHGWDTLPDGVLAWRAAVVESLAAAERWDESDRLVGQLHDEQRHGDPAVGTDWARAAGVVALGAGRVDEAVTLLDAGLRIDPQGSRPYERARLAVTVGSGLRRAGRRTAAAKSLTIAAALFDRIGAEPWMAAVDRELAACGLRPARRSERPPFESLSPQERTVAQIVASGRSNREVAAELFISPKTVENHLSRIYAKLGLRSRGQLAAALRDDVDGHRSPW